MSATDFVNQLHESGHVVVPLDSTPLDDVGLAVQTLDSAARFELAFAAPALDIAAASWALTQLYHGCQFLTYRHVDAAAVGAVLATPCPKPPSVEVCYSVDLAFKFLPDLITLAAGISPADPLVVQLTRLASEWPLSSVGVAGIEKPDVTPFINSPTLAMLYVDRIVERGDASRLVDPFVKAKVQAAIGAYPQLAPKLASALAIGQAEQVPRKD